MIHNNLKTLGFKVGENNVVSFYCSDPVLPIRMAPKLTQKHVDMAVFSGRMKGWRQGNIVVLFHYTFVFLHVLAIMLNVLRVRNNKIVIVKALILLIGGQIINVAKRN